MFEVRSLRFEVGLTSNFGLRTWNFFKLIWQDTKEIFETFREIREIIETHLIGNFADRCSFSGYELCGALKPEIPDKLIYRLVCRLNFTKQIFTAHPDLDLQTALPKIVDPLSDLP